MRTVFVVALSVLLGVLPAAAIEPKYSDQVVPAAPQLKLIDGIVGDQQLVFIETATMGRVGDTGYVWKAVMPGIAGSPPVFTRLVIDCPGNVIREDWRTSFGTDLQPTGHEQLSSSYIAADPISLTIVSLACGGQPATPDHLGIAAAMDWLIARQGESDLALAGLDPSLVQIGTSDLPVRTLIFVDENSGEWLIGSGQATIRQFQAYARPTDNGKGTLIQGGWIDVVFDCDVKPITYAASTIVQIEAETLADLPEQPAAPGVQKAQPGTIAAEIADFACSQTPMRQLAGAPRYTSLQAAIAAAAAPGPVAEVAVADDLYDTQPPPSNLSLVRIADQPEPQALTLFYDENSVALNLGTAWVWQFIAFKAPVSFGAGESAHGLWVQMQYMCFSPSTAHAMGTVPVGMDGELLSWMPPEISDHDVADDSREMDMVDHACRQQSIDGQRARSTAEALQIATR